MSTLADIESAVDRLTAGEKQRLLLYLVARLRAIGGGMPPPRQFSKDQVNGWIADDEAAMQQLRDPE